MPYFKSGHADFRPDNRQDRQARFNKPVTGQKRDAFAKTNFKRPMKSADTFETKDQDLYSKNPKPGDRQKFGAKDRSYRRSVSLSEHENQIRRKGFSPFQLRLVNSILEDVLVKHRPLDRTYAYWFSKVKIQSVEQGFLIRQINAMFCRLSFYAFISNLKRPSDFERHVGRLVFSYCAEKGWPLPELAGEEGFDRRGLAKRMEQGLENPLFKDGCPIWLEELGNLELKDRWPQERQALGTEAKRFIRCNTLKTTRENLAHLLAEEGVVTKPVLGSSIALEVTSNSALFRTKAFKDGLFEQQDAGSQQIGAFLDPKPGQRVIDACAGAGGKTLHLSALMAGKGVIIAMDTESWKLDELKKRARRAGAFNIEPKLIDSSKVIKRLVGTADKVLIDAPCSGTGVLRRMPDSKWKDGRAGLNELHQVQQDILSRYALMAKVGGVVVYSTCSILPSENQDQIKAFLEKNENQFKLEEEQQILPSSGFDGFYMAKLKRIG